MYHIQWTNPKIIYAVWGAIMSFTADIHTAMLGLVVCMVVDTITGFVAAPYRGQMRNSHGLSRFVQKIITYFVAAIILHITERLILPTYVAGSIEMARIAFAIFAALEVYSTLENLYDITGLRAFRLLTGNFREILKDKVGINVAPKGKKHVQKAKKDKPKQASVS